MENKLERIKSVAVYCGSKTAGEVFEKAAAELGEFIAKHGMTLVFGGSNVGTMKTLADAALKAGGKVIGVFTTNLPSALLHDGVTEAIMAHSLAERKREMIARADAMIALPGGLGTLDELFDALALRRIKHGGHKKPVGVLNVSGYYDGLLDFIRHTNEKGFSSKAAVQNLISGRTVEELFKRLAGSLPPERESAKPSLKELWRKMARNRKTYGKPGGMMFANAFYSAALNFPPEAWRECGDEIAIEMLAWVDDMDAKIWRNLDCSEMVAWDWVELLQFNPLVLAHPKCPVDEIHPLDLMQAICTEPECVRFVDGNAIARELKDDEHVKEFFWSQKAIECARKYGAEELAELIERKKSEPREP